MALACALGGALAASGAEQVPAGMTPYSKPVFRNGHLVLWHGPSHGGGVRARAEVGSSKSRQFTILLDASEPSEARVASEMSAQAKANGFGLKPVAGKTSLSAIGKAIAAHSADFVISPVDALLAAAKGQPDWKDRAPYIARLANEPIEIIAPRTIADVSQLSGRKVNVEAADSATAATAALLFARLNIAPKLANGFLADALGDLTDGKIDGVLVIGGRGSKSLADFSRDGRFHILNLPWTAAVQPLYSPARLANADQPTLIAAGEKVDTLSVGMALLALDAAPASPRAEKVGAFATQFLSRFDALLDPANAPGWKDVNLAASIDAWPRLAAAQAWVDQGKSDAGHALDNFRTIAQSAAAPDQGPSSADSDRLYDSLMKWRATQ